MDTIVKEEARVPLRDRLTPDKWRRMAALPVWKATSGNFKLSDESVLGWDTAVLANTVGMHHAFDADYISAIDNISKILMSEGQRPLAVGFFN